MDADAAPARPHSAAVFAALARPDVQAAAAMALAAAAVLWGTSFVAAKAVLAETPPLMLAFLRFFIAAVVLVPISRRAGGRLPLGGREAALGLAGIALFIILQNAGLQLASAADATLVLGGGLPVFAAALGLVLLGERPGPRPLAGLGCSIAGVAGVALAGGTGGGDHGRGGGLLLLLAAAGCGALAAVLGRRAFGGPDFLAVLAGSTVWGALLLLPPAVAELALVGAALPSGRGAALLLYLGLGCSALAYALWAYGLRHLGAARASVIGNIELPIGVAAAALLLGENVGAAPLVGTGLILVGAALAALAPTGPAAGPIGADGETGAGVGAGAGLTR